MREILVDVSLVAVKDLKIELRSRVLINQVVPFALLVLLLFGIALDADQETLRSFASGLFWIAILLCTLLAVQRSSAIERLDDAVTGLRLSSLSTFSLFLGKTAAVFVQILFLEVLLTGGIIFFYQSSVEDIFLLILTGLTAGIAIAATGTLYGAMVAGLGVRETLLPILLLPVLAPILIGAVRAFDDALGVGLVNGWTWLALLAASAVFLITVGALAHQLLLED